MTDELYAFDAKVLATRIGLVNIHKTLATVPCCYKQVKVAIDKLGRRYNTWCLSKDGVAYILRKSRKKNIAEIAAEYEIKLDLLYIPSIERSTLDIIMKIFARENMEEQYQIRVKDNKYIIDLYFVDYKLAVECDEIHHITYDEKDRKREDELCSVTNLIFIRYKPHSKDFDISDAIKAIYDHISEIKNNKTN